MTKTTDVVELYDEFLTNWIGERRRQRMDAIMPGAGVADLVEKLRDSQKADWYRICAEHASERAEELCTLFLDGDLLYRDGEALWNMFWWPEIERALRIARASRTRRLKGSEAARGPFITSVERIREQRLGPPDVQKALREAEDCNLPFSETFSECCERLEREHADA